MNWVLASVLSIIIEIAIGIGIEIDGLIIRFTN